jgi:hypothetical protein
LLGVMLGLIPAGIFALGASISGFYSNGGPGWPFLGCLLFPVVVIFMGIFLSRQDFRPLGYGLLAAAVISPVIVTISCSVATRA